jgi:glycosyltransferase involved in cell wall biosynthesis/pimeloyl-ACP methyl ester carboxylesterase
MDVGQSWKIVHAESSREFGGQERRVLSESVGMRDRGHDVSIATPRGGALAHHAADAGLDVIAVSFERSRLLGSVRRVASLLRRLRPDVFVTHSSEDSWPSALACRIAPRPGALIRSRHISAQVSPGPLHRFLYRQSDFLITTGEAIRRELADSGLADLDRSASIPTGIDLDHFRPDPTARGAVRHALGLQAETPVIGVVAFLRQDKGHVVLLEAMRAIHERHPGAVLLVIGDGPERDRLAARVKALGLDPAVRFLGRREDIPALLSSLDVFCLPSIRNEVSTRVGGIPEAVRDGASGYLVDPADPAALADALVDLLADPGRRARWGVAGRAHVSEHFSIQGMLDRTEAAYTTALTMAARRLVTPPGRSMMQRLPATRSTGPGPALLAHRRLVAPDAHPDRWVLFLHGFLGAGRNWGSIGRGLVDARPDWGVVLVDLRLHGKSQGFAPPHTIASCAADVNSLLLHLGGREAVIVGHSFGGKVALAAARPGSSVIRQVWVVDSTPERGRTDAGADRLLAALARMPASWTDRRAAVATIEEAGFEPTIAEWAATNLWKKGNAYEWRFDLPSLELLLADFYREDLWSVVESPPHGVELVFLQASRNSILRDEAASRIARQEATGGRVRLFAVEGGHWLNMSNPEKVLGLLGSELPH